MKEETNLPKKGDNNSSGELFPEIAEREKHLRSFLPGPFIVASLPARAVSKIPFKRKYNDITLTLSGDGQVPFGKYGRLLLTILTTHAVLTKGSEESSVKIMYKSIGQLLNELQLPKTRGKEIKEQLEYFSKATFIFEERKTTKVKKYMFKDLFENPDAFEDDIIATGVSTGVIPFLSSLKYIDTSDKKNNRETLAISITLSAEFTKYSRKHSVPIDYTVYKEITSPTGKDLYAWLLYRCNSVTEPIFISAGSLVEQFMPLGEDVEVTRQSKYWSRIKEEIIEIKTKYCPFLNISICEDNTGIILKKSVLPQLKDSEHYVLITSTL